MEKIVRACCMQAFGIKELNIKIMFKFSKPRTLDTGWTSRRNSTDVHKCVELINQSITCLAHIYYLFLRGLNNNLNFQIIIDICLLSCAFCLDLEVMRRYPYPAIGETQTQLSRSLSSDAVMHSLGAEFHLRRRVQSS